MPDASNKLDEHGGDAEGVGNARDGCDLDMHVPAEACVRDSGCGGGVLTRTVEVEVAGDERLGLGRCNTAVTICW